MSASEKLKARLWPVWDVEPLSVAERQAVVEVVEAAENYSAIQQPKRPVNELNEVVALKLSLAALDEALT